MGIKKFVTKQIFFFTGLPLSGKSHVTKLLAGRIHNSYYISTGDIARSLVKDSVEQKQMEAKDLYPGEEALRTELKRQVDETTATCVIVDGFPRFPEQATYLADTFFHLFPVVIDVTTTDLQTLAYRATLRARDSRDTDHVEFANRLKLAMQNSGDISSVLNARLVPHYTIVSTADENSIFTQFRKIVKQRP